MGFEILAQLGGKLVEILEDSVDAAISGDEPGGGLFADTWNAFHVVDGIAHEGLNIDSLFGGIAELIDHALAIHEGVGLHVVNLRESVDELAQVFVFRDDVNIDIFVRHLADKGGDEVVGFKSGLGKNGDAGIADDLQDALFLREKVIRGRLTVGLIVRGDFLAEDGFIAAVDDHGQVIGFAILDEVNEPLGKDESGLGGLAGWAGKIAKGREIGPVNLGVAIDDIETFAFGHCV